MDKFSLEYYRKSIKAGLKNHYVFECCKNYNKKIAEKIILLRHDVDFNLENALKMAEIEYSLNVSSTYFIRLHAKNYNLLEYKNLNIIKKIISMNHEIGLHFEPDIYSHSSKCISEYIENEVIFLSKIIETPIVGASIHEPSRRGNKINNKIVGKTSLQYESYLLPSSYKYISDSGGRWREGDMLEWINKKVKKIYVNTHPVWWYNNTPIENY